MEHARLTLLEFQEGIVASKTITKNPGPGRPLGEAQRPRIALPDEGEELWPYYTDWSDDTGINAKTLQRIKRQMPLVTIAGVIYIKNKAGRRALAEPSKKSRGARR
jgi:hypothetical protein